jgi:hypothetical protein
MSLLQRVRLLALCTHPEDREQTYVQDAGSVQICGRCGARRTAGGGTWQRPELLEQLVKFAAIKRVHMPDLSARIICAELDAEELTKAALVAWRAVQQAEAAMLDAPDRAAEGDQRIARLGENDASAHVALLSAILAGDGGNA